jgi:neutral trehalase
VPKEAPPTHKKLISVSTSIYLITLNPAGDRFRETYYWDSYWVVRGLLVSRMTQTAAGLIDNLMSMLEAVGHVPNGARVYYLNRRWVGV